MGNSQTKPSPEVVTEPEGGPPVAHINCGGVDKGHDSNENVRVIGKTRTYSNPSIEIKGDRADFVSFGRSHRWSSTDFTYMVSVPVPGEYDVTLVFCETFDGAFGAGKRIFDATVTGTKTFNFDGIDVFAEAGANTIHTIVVQNVPAEYEIVITLKKGPVQNPFISGLVVGAVENPSAKPERPPIPQPDVTVTKAQYDDCIEKIDTYITAAKQNKPEGPIREVPQFMFHEPGTKIRGLIVTYHGFSGRHYDHRILNRYLYDNGYDVFNTMLSGHMYTGKYWPTTKLSKEYGGDTVAGDIMSDPELGAMAAGINQNPGQIPTLLTRLREANPDFERVMSAQTYMTSLEKDEDPNFSTFFDSTHRLYADDGIAQLRLLDAHPGPVHVTGLSVGGAVALAVAAANPERIERCITMAPLLELYEQYPNTKRSLVNYIGPLSVAPDFAWDPETPFPVSAFTAVGRFGGSITSSEKYQQVFMSKQVQMFMILTEDEDAADIPTNRQFFRDCGGRGAGHHFFIYPLSYKVPHPLLDPTGMFTSNYPQICTG